MTPELMQRAQVGEHGEDAAVDVLALGHTKLLRDMADVCFDGSLAQVPARLQRAPSVPAGPRVSSPRYARDTGA